MTELNKLLGRDAAGGLSVHIDEGVTLRVFGPTVADKGDAFFEKVVDPRIVALGAHHDHGIDPPAFDEAAKCGELGGAAFGCTQEKIQTAFGQGPTEIRHLVDKKGVAERSEVARHNQSDGIQPAGTKALCERVGLIAVGLSRLANPLARFRADIGVSGERSRDGGLREAEMSGQLV